MNKSQLPGAEEWRQIIGGQANSGLTVAAYCLERGITQGSFYIWKRRLRQPARRNRSPHCGHSESLTPFPTRLHCQRKSAGPRGAAASCNQVHTVCRADLIRDCFAQFAAHSARDFRLRIRRNPTPQNRIVPIDAGSGTETLTSST